MKISKPASVKRAATVITPKARSQSVETGASTMTDSRRASDDRSARTLGLMNIPDTVNDSRIRTVAEPYGPLVKIVLRPEREGAIVEFVDVTAAGKASLGLEGHEITPGRRIRVGSANDVMSKHDASSNTTTNGKAKSAGALMPQNAGPIKRPAQPGTGRRGGLGVKRGGSTASTRGTEHLEKHDSRPEKTSQKTNDDFRAMISGQKEQT